ncbi:MULTISPECIES: type VI secretion system baseplate subunit TssK [Providencia]|uniref:Type VI secretion system baseplate subunit TssK n=1 Tax=Providencia rettgeri TaxID=587 RepID=A0AAD2VPU4_PRORE|nr:MULTISPECIES: type VI secretion system baseplate subunit TssK [Providencia]ELR5072827.1 type VI secretion system baseplate subunit TssK [Providencia stuartii]ELR5070965.1 type VI secretion system baseplate subunit TssK [Providencia rettgeri]ELR5216011.1 type VI secretion system baseplate subunit TssK [Providencia rettgeri]ELR5223064.1 type VI secretion system baseplate subunit TssK [Providencia rettgeri]MBV2191468.1 type VI secretion system baseplate subunit TssK [Providencia rettgeri]
MSTKNRVIWREGLFIKPQHFQQQQRHQDYVTESILKNFISHFWGFSHLSLSNDLYSLGRIGIKEASGVMPDGTIFSFPNQDLSPQPIDIQNITDSDSNIIYLAFPLTNGNVNEISNEHNGSRLLSRYSECIENVRDLHTENGDLSTIHVAQLNPILKQGKSGLDAYVALPICRIRERNANGSITLDDDYIPSLLNIRASLLLNEFLTEIEGTLYERGKQIASRIGAPGQQGVADVAEFMMLQVLNRSYPLYSHYAQEPVIHPEKLFRDLLELCGELQTFTNSSRLPDTIAKYKHFDLTNSFLPLIKNIREALSVVLTPRAIPIPLQIQEHGIRVATIHDKQLLQKAEFIIAVKSQMPQEQLRKQFPQQTKVTTVNNIRSLVSVQIPGVPLSPLSTAPRQLPYHSGYNYFHFDQQGNEWKGIQQDGNIAFHVSGNFPDLDIQLWAIRDGALYD